MSYCLQIPLREPLSLPDLILAVESELATLLNWSEALEITVARTSTLQGLKLAASSLPNGLAAEAAFVEVDLHMEGVGSAHVLCLTLPGTEGALCAKVSRRGGSKVLAAACAIALSRLSGHPIGGDTYILDTRCHADWNAPSVSEVLRCRHNHATLEGAAEEVSTTIKRRQAGF